jgi:uncharacterized protein YbcI
MDQLSQSMAEQLAHAARAFQFQQTGHSPTSVTVVLSEDALVITLHEALSPVEKALARSDGGAAKVQEFHRHLFQSACATLFAEITRITGVRVREAAAEVELATSAVVHAFTSGTMVQVFHLDENLPVQASTVRQPLDLP